MNINREEGLFTASRMASTVRKITAIEFSGIEWLSHGKMRSKRDYGLLNITSANETSIKSILVLIRPLWPWPVSRLCHRQRRLRCAPDKSQADAP
jgi:hypothetical protein